LCFGDFTLKGCKEISQGLSERSERNPWVEGSLDIRILKGCEGSSHPFQGAINRGPFSRGTQKTRTPG